MSHKKQKKISVDNPLTLQERQDNPDELFGSDTNDASDINPNYSCFKVNWFLFLHCLSGFYFGYQYTILNNLGKPILQHGMNIKESDAIDEWMGNFNLAFGMGKVVGSLVGGSLAKKIGKLNVLFVAEIWNAISSILLFWPNKYMFMVSRIFTGFCCGFNSTNAPRQILENYPIHNRGLPPSFYSLFICIGLCFSFSTGKIFGDKLNDWWLFFMLFPNAVLQLRAIQVQITCRHETPIHYQVKSDEIEDLDKKGKQLDRRDYLLSTFFMKNSEIVLEKSRLATITTELKHKKTEKGLQDLIYTNLIDKNQRYAALACIMFNVYPPFAGQAYSDSYTTRIFDKLVYDGFGYEVTFYSGFAAQVGGILMILCVNRIGRRPIIIWSQFGHFICMYLLAIAFYYDWQWFAQAVNLFYTFLLYWGTMGITYAFMNETGEPFTVGVSCAANWITKSLMNVALPYIYDDQPIYWTPMVMGIAGMILWFICQPLYLECKDKTYVQISKEYREFKYNILKF